MDDQAKPWQAWDELMMVDGYGWLWMAMVDDLMDESKKKVPNVDLWTFEHSSSKHPNA